jgi:hypothetical protein
MRLIKVFCIDIVLSTSSKTQCGFIIIHFVMTLLSPPMCCRCQGCCFGLRGSYCCRSKALITMRILRWLLRPSSCKFHSSCCRSSIPSPDLLGSPLLLERQYRVFRRQGAGVEHVPRKRGTVLLYFPVFHHFTKEFRVAIVTGPSQLVG